MATTTFGYYTTDKMPNILNGGVLGGASAYIAGFEQAIISTLEKNLTLPNIFISFALIFDGISGVSTHTLKVIYNDDETFSIDGYRNNMRISLHQAELTFFIAEAIFLVTGPVSVLSAAAIAAGTSVIFSVVDTAVGASYGSGLPDNLRFYDKNGNFVSGVFYPDGMDGTAQQNENAVRYFISKAQTEIANGGTIKIETSAFDTQLDSTYTLYNGSFTNILVGMTAATSVADFLNTGDKKNLNSHAFAPNNPAAGGKEYYFFKDNNVALDIPVMIGGVKQVITVNNIYDGVVDSARSLLGTGTGKNLIMSTGLSNTITGGSGDDLLLSGVADNTMVGGDGNDTLIGGGGSDYMQGNYGNDILDGGTGVDNLDGGIGNDKLYGGSDSDTLYGRDGADILDGGADTDILNGGADIDELRGGAGDDILDGGTGNDILLGGEDSDTMTGGTGADKFIIDDGDGIDTIMDPESGDRLVYNGVTVEGSTKNIENGVYRLKGFVLQKQGSDLFVTSNGSGSGVTIKNYFAGANGNMGIYISEDKHAGEDTEFYLASPIVLDLNGDGIKYIPYDGLSLDGLTTRHNHFDIDNDGFAEGIEWINKNDGFLVRDLNGNGAIDNQKEMFGDDSGTTAYAKLALFDTNNDGKIDSADTSFTTLKIWQDLDSDSLTDAGELKTLAQAGISSLSLQLTNATILDGHAIAGTSSFTRTDGTVGIAADVMLEMNNEDNLYVGSDLTKPPALDLSTIFLPLSRGHGAIKPLQYAMTDSPVLKQMVIDLVNIDTNTQMHEVYDRVNDIILEWTGAKNIAPTGQDIGRNAQKLAVLKLYYDTDIANIDDVDIAYSKFFYTILANLVSQGPLKKVFPLVEYYYDVKWLDLGGTYITEVIGNRGVVAFQQTHQQLLEQAKLFVPTNPADKAAYWDIILHIMQTSTYDKPTTQEVEAAAGFNLEGEFYSTIIIGSAGNDVLYGTDPFGNGYTTGDFKGLGGDDIFYFGGLNQLYYNLGDGSDTVIIDPTEQNQSTINFGYGITFDSIAFQYVANATDSNVKDLLITIPGSGSIRYVNNGPSSPIPTMNFADGSVKGYADANYKIYGGMGTAGDDWLYGASGGITMNGFAGNDSIYGGTGNDTIYGGDGNDSIGGDDGIDTIYGDAGNDTLYGGAGADKIDGGVGVDTASYSGSTAAVNVNISIATTQSGGYAQGDILSNIENLTGSDNNDVLTGNSGDNIINGGYGADKIDGGAGIDTVTYSSTKYGAAVNVNLSLTTAQSGGDAQGDILSNIENIIGSVYGDTLTGNSGDNVIKGGNGADKIDGGAGIDTVSYSGLSTGGVNVNLAVTTAQSGNYAQGDTLSNIENIIGSPYDDILIGNSGDNIIESGNGYDQVDGGAGIDTISYVNSTLAVFVNIGTTNAQSGGDAHGDTLLNIENIIASAYNDKLTGSSVANRIDGASGVDTVSYANSTAAVNVNLGLTTAQSGGFAAGDTLVSIENIIGSSYNDTLTGTSLANKIEGGSGVDTVSYAGSNAAVNVNLAVTTAQVGGHAAGDTLFNIENIIGSSYSDTLKGTSIANIINGGTGNDKMTGGSGADIFKFSAVTDSGKAAGARDIITDFVKGTDKIDLADFAGTFAFKGTGALGGSVAGVNYAQVSGNTIIGIDADSNGTLDMQIELTGLHTLAASDFLL